MKFRKKPVVIEAIQWDGTENGCQRVKAMFPAIQTLGKTGHLVRPEVTYWKIGTLEGGHLVSPGDWIIKGVAGEFYPCKPDIFAATYEPASEPLASQRTREMREAYVTCHECSNCGHIGINDESETDAACNTCGWHGPSPQEDKCPECDREGTMSSSCPKCGNRYHLLAETRLAALSPSISEPSCVNKEKVNGVS